MTTPQINRSEGRELQENPGFVLRSDAAYAWDRAVREFGKKVLLTGAWRSYETQERLFRERYRSGSTSPFNDYRFWPTYLGGDGRTWGRVTGAAAAVPGTSNHGGGIAVDVKTRRSPGDPGYDTAVIWSSWSDPDRVRFLKVAAKYGWDDDEGRQVGEVWHLTYYPSRDQYRGKAAPSYPVDTQPVGNAALVKRVENMQGAVGAVKDGVWGPNTQKRLSSVRLASPMFGEKFPYGVDDTQWAVGAAPDGSWGPDSRAAHIRTVKEIQKAMGVTADGVWGGHTDSMYKAIRAKALK
jgi:hypothetical protein